MTARQDGGVAGLLVGAELDDPWGPSRFRRHLRGSVRRVSLHAAYPSPAAPAAFADLLAGVPWARPAPPPPAAAAAAAARVEIAWPRALGLVRVEDEERAEPYAALQPDLPSCVPVVFRVAAAAATTDSRDGGGADAQAPAGAAAGGAGEGGAAWPEPESLSVEASLDSGGRRRAALAAWGRAGVYTRDTAEAGH